MYARMYLSYSWPFFLIHGQCQALQLVSIKLFDFAKCFKR